MYYQLLTDPVETTDKWVSAWKNTLLSPRTNINRLISVVHSESNKYQNLLAWQGRIIVQSVTSTFFVIFFVSVLVYKLQRGGQFRISHSQLYCTQFETFYWFSCCWYGLPESLSVQVHYVILDGASRVCTKIQQEVARIFPNKSAIEDTIKLFGHLFGYHILTSFYRSFEII